MEALALLLIIGFGLTRIYFINKTYLSLSEFRTVKGRVLDARIVNDAPSFYYQYKVDGVVIGGRCFNTVDTPIKHHELSAMFPDGVNPDTPQFIDIHFHKDNPLQSIIKKPTWKTPVDGVFLAIVPSIYLFIEVLL